MAFIFVGASYYSGLVIFLICMVAAMATTWLLTEVLSDEGVVFLTNFRGGIPSVVLIIFLLYAFVLEFAVMMPSDKVLVGAGVLLLGVAGILVGAALFGSGDEEEEEADEDWLDESKSDEHW